MLAAAFSFQGRITRLQYFLGALALGFAAVVLGVTAIAVVMAGRNAGMTLLLIPIAMAAGGAFIWVSLSLQARRFRDIGWNPTLMIGGTFAMALFDFGLAKAVPSLAIGPQHASTPIGGGISLLVTCCLLFWPSKADDGADATPLDGPSPYSPPPRAPMFTPPPAVAPVQPVRYIPAPANAPRSTFGRRGL